MVVVFPTPVGPTSATKRRRPGSTWIGPETRNSASIIRASWALISAGSDRKPVRHFDLQAIDQFAGQFLADAGFDQIGEHSEQRTGQFARSGALRAAAEIFDHRMQIAEPAFQFVAECAARLLLVGGARRRRVAAACSGRAHWLRQDRGPCRRGAAIGWAHSRWPTRSLPRGASRASGETSRRMRTSRVCSTAASGPNSRRTKSNASCIVRAR